MDEPDRDRVEEVQFFPPRSAGYHQAGILEETQVFHYTEARHFEFRLELGQGQAVVSKEPVEQGAPCWVGESLEYPVVIVHEHRIGDQKVTCQ